MPLKIAKTIATFRPTPLARHDFWYEYNAERIDYSIWLSKNTTDIKTILFLGTVQIGKLPVWVANACPPGTIVVQGAPHWLAKEDGSDIAEFMHRFAHETLESILRTYSIKKVAIIAESQAVPSILRLATTNPAYITRVVALQPLGFNANAFTGNSSERARLFLKRIKLNFRYQRHTLPVDRRLAHNMVQMLRTVGINNARSNAQYAAGLTYDTTIDAEKLQNLGVPLAIICGDYDQLFPVDEIEATLQQKNIPIPVITVPNVPHSPLAARQGIKLLLAAFDYINKNS